MSVHPARLPRTGASRSVCTAKLRIFCDKQKKTYKKQRRRRSGGAVFCGESSVLEFGEARVKDFEHLDGAHGDAGAGAEDGGNACAIEEVIVLGGDYAAGGDHDVFATEFLEFFDYLRNQSL